MLIKKWEKLPAELQIEEVRPYYEILRKKNFSLFWKRVFDIVVSGIMLIIFSPFFLPPSTYSAALPFPPVCL